MSDEEVDGIPREKHEAPGADLAKMLDLKETLKPYDYQGPVLMQGDPVGWVDADGRVRIETFKAYGPDGIEVFQVEGRTAGQIAAVAAFIEHGREVLERFVE